MDVHCSAIAGYGVEIEGNLTEKGEILLTKCNGEIKNLAELLKWQPYLTQISCNYSGEDKYILLVDDPIEDFRYEDFLKFLDKNEHLLDRLKPKWTCELHIS